MKMLAFSLPGNGELYWEELADKKANSTLRKETRVSI
jgi:hypothetical protein